MVKILTGTEAMCVEEALKDAYQMLDELEVDSRDIAHIKEALKIMKALRQKSIEEVIGE